MSENPRVYLEKSTDSYCSIFDNFSITYSLCEMYSFLSDLSYPITVI